MIKTLKDIKPHDNNKVRIAFIGDSLTEGTGVGAVELRPVFGYPGQLQTLLGDDYVVGNFGKSGAYTLDATNIYNIKKDASLSYRNTKQYKDSLCFNADVVVIMIGINDIRSMSCDEAAQELKKALKSLFNEYAALPTVQKVYVATSMHLPSSSTIFQYSDGPLQDLQKEVAAECGYDVLDIYSMTRDYINVKLHYFTDHIHPNKESYGELARAYYCALMGLEYTATVPPVSESGVVYVKDGGLSQGLGDTPETAIDSIAKAAGLLRNGGKIVICGKYSLAYETHMPFNSQKITVTSTHNGIDYQQVGATLGMSKLLYLYGEYSFENITISSEVNGAAIVCNYNNVIFNDNITSVLSGDVSSYPLIIVGHDINLGDAPVESISLHGECRVNVNSGIWAYIRGGNRRKLSSFPVGTSDEDAELNITVNGGKFTSTEQNLTSATGMGGFAGRLNFTINGGEFLGDIFAVCRAGAITNNTPAVMSGNITLNINGGNYMGSICAVQDNTVKITGTCSINISEKVKANIVGF